MLLSCLNPLQFKLYQVLSILLAGSLSVVLTLIQLLFIICAGLVIQSCPTLCNPMDCSLPGSSVHGDSPGKNTGVGCDALLQGIFPTQGSDPGLLHCRQILFQLSYHRSPISYLDHWNSLLTGFSCYSLTSFQSFHSLNRHLIMSLIYLGKKQDQ